MNEFEEKQLEYLRQISEDIRAVNVKTDKMILLLKKVVEKTEDM